MSFATISIDSKIRDAYMAYCKNNGLVARTKIEKLMIMDLYKAGYDVKELIIINKRQNSIKELNKRQIIEPAKVEENKMIKEDNNGSV